jgi:hypothetical protein
LRSNFKVEKLVYIAGEYGDFVIGVCTPTRRPTVNYGLKTYVFDLEGQNLRQLILPYKRYRNSSLNGARFVHLRIVSCGEDMFMELIYYSKVTEKAVGRLSYSLFS